MQRAGLSYIVCIVISIIYYFVSMRNNAIIIIIFKWFQPTKPNVEPNVWLDAGRGGGVGEEGGGGGGALTYTCRSVWRSGSKARRRMRRLDESFAGTKCIDVSCLDVECIDRPGRFVCQCAPSRSGLYCQRGASRIIHALYSFIECIFLMAMPEIKLQYYY